VSPILISDNGPPASGSAYNSYRVAPGVAFHRKTGVHMPYVGVSKVSLKLEGAGIVA